MTRLARLTPMALAAALAAGCGGHDVIRASHQWPDGDVRGALLEQIREELVAADVGLEMRIYPGQSLFEATEQWAAITRGRLDISVFPLAYAAGRHPEFNLTLMPGIVTSHEHAARFNRSPFMDEIRRRIEDAGGRRARRRVARGRVRLEARMHPGARRRARADDPGRREGLRADAARRGSLRDLDAELRDLHRDADRRARRDDHEQHQLRLLPTLRAGPVPHRARATRRCGSCTSRC